MSWPEVELSTKNEQPGRPNPKQIESGVITSRSVAICLTTAVDPVASSPTSQSPRGACSQRR